MLGGFKPVTQCRSDWRRECSLVRLPPRCPQARWEFYVREPRRERTTRFEAAYSECRLLHQGLARYGLFISAPSSSACSQTSPARGAQPWPGGQSRLLPTPPPVPPRAACVPGGIAGTQETADARAPAGGPRVLTPHFYGGRGDCSLPRCLHSRGLGFGLIDTEIFPAIRCRVVSKSHTVQGAPVSSCPRRSL